MAHIDQINFVKEFKDYYINNKFNKDINILEVGSLDVNGSIKDLFNFCNDYTGIDLEKGPNVDLVMDGSEIYKLNKKFDMVISCECFEHAKNWKIIFKQMCEVAKENAFVLISVASTGRIEYGTQRSGNWQSPGNKDDYYLNLTKKDFVNNFDLNNIFSNYFFYYNINSFDLYFVGIKGHNEKNTLEPLYNKLKILFKRKKIRKILIFIYSYILNENLRQDIFFFKKFIKKKIKNLIKI